MHSYHSCKNRSCPKCHIGDTEHWLESRKLEMLPCNYFHVTVTVPEELHGGGVSTGPTPCWHPARPSFLALEVAIAKLVRGKLKAWFAQRRPDLTIPDTAWTTPWVVRITPWGEGQEAVLRYLARYIFRVAITDARIIALDERSVCFRCKHRQSSRWRTSTLAGHESMRRFLQHVLPKGLHKVRYFGLWHPSKRAVVPVCSSTCNAPNTSRQRP